MGVVFEITCSDCGREIEDREDCFCQKCLSRAVEDARGEGYDDGYEKGQEDMEVEVD